ncbi:MAG TPA: hypothetical protein VFY90_01190 [Tepidiformaceae bacterium]|nr:hypothetical protein [Tepidiformaceae bacterium]
MWGSFRLGGRWRISTGLTLEGRAYGVWGVGSGGAVGSEKTDAGQPSLVDDALLVETGEAGELLRGASPVGAALAVGPDDGAAVAVQHDDQPEGCGLSGR